MLSIMNVCKDRLEDGVLTACETDALQYHLCSIRESATAGIFIFLYFALNASNLSLFQHEARVLRILTKKTTQNRFSPDGENFPV